MKNVLTILTTTILFTVLGASCVKNKPNCGALPCPTATGANVASCFMNGLPYIVTGNTPSISMLSCHSGNTFKHDPNTNGINFNFFNCGQKYSDMWFSIFDSLKIGNYKIGKPLENASSLILSGSTGSLYSDSNTIGNIAITSIKDHSVSGTFNFELKDKNAVLIKCTNGNFDLAK